MFALPKPYMTSNNLGRSFLKTRLPIDLGLDRSGSVNSNTSLAVRHRYPDPHAIVTSPKHRVSVLSGHRPVEFFQKIAFDRFTVEGWLLGQLASSATTLAISSLCKLNRRSLFKRLFEGDISTDQRSIGTLVGWELMTRDWIFG